MGGEQVEETGGGDEGGEYPQRAPDPENRSERSGEQRADGHHREPDGPGRRRDPAEYVRRDIGLHKAVGDHVPDDDDAPGAHHRDAGEGQPWSLVRDREQQRKAQAASDGDEHSPRRAEPPSEGPGDKCAQDAANAEAGHDQAGRGRGQPDGADEKDNQEGASTPVSARLASDENAVIARR
jgi:hypothetical protein